MIFKTNTEKNNKNFYDKTNGKNAIAYTTLSKFDLSLNFLIFNVKSINVNIENEKT